MSQPEEQKDLTADDLQYIKQWMDLVNKLLNNHLSSARTIPCETDYSIRLMQHLTQKIGVTSTEEKVPYLILCPHCKKGFDHYYVIRGPYEDDHLCPHCKKARRSNWD